MTRRVLLRHRLVYWAARTTLFAVNLLPERVAYGMFGAAGRLFFRCSRHRRQCALRMLRYAYPEGKTDAELLRLGSLGTANLFKVALDSVRVIPWVRAGRLRERCDPGELETFPPAPFIGLSAHLGSWEVGAITTALIRGEAHAIAREFKNPLLQRFILANRQRAGFIVHPRRGGIRPLVRALEAGHVGMQVADQRQRQRGVVVPFFGQPASTDRSVAVLALRLGYPVVVGALVRVGPGFRFRGIATAPVEVVPTGDREADIARITAEVNRRMEELVLRQPDQYLWIHDRYRRKREEPDDPAAR